LCDAPTKYGRMQGSRTAKTRSSIIKPSENLKKKDGVVMEIIHLEAMPELLAAYILLERDRRRHLFFYAN
jgi:hypothetical protein